MVHDTVRGESWAFMLHNVSNGHLSEFLKHRLRDIDGPVQMVVSFAARGITAQWGRSNQIQSKSDLQLHHDPPPLPFYGNT